MKLMQAAELELMLTAALCSCRATDVQHGAGCVALEHAQIASHRACLSRLIMHGVKAGALTLLELLHSMCWWRRYDTFSVSVSWGMAHQYIMPIPTAMHPIPISSS